MGDGVTQHYGSTGIADRVLAAIAAGGGDLGQLRPEMLFPYDQLHARELKATEEHVAWLAPRPNEHVLDVGSASAVRPASLRQKRRPVLRVST